MGSRQCIFGNETIGDYVLGHWPDIQAATPALVLTGLYRGSARLVAQGANLQYRHVVKIAVVRDTPEALSLYAETLQRLLFTTADFVIRVDDEDARLGEGWMLLEAPTPRPLDGHGGRFIESWELTFGGDGPLQNLTA